MAAAQRLAQRARVRALRRGYFMHACAGGVLEARAPAARRQLLIPPPCPAPSHPAFRAIPPRPCFVAAAGIGARTGKQEAAGGVDDGGLPQPGHRSLARGPHPRR